MRRIHAEIGCSENDRTASAPACLVRGLGFTLVEIIAVLVLISLLSVLALTSIDTGSSELRVAAEKLRSNLRYSQAMAMKDSSFWTITLTSTGYSLTSGSTGSGFPGGEGTSVTLPSGLSITSGAGALGFDTRGRPFLNGSALSSAHTVTVGNGSDSRSVTIQPLTGFMEVS